MINVTRYKIYPNKSMQDAIFEQFGICTELRNWCLDNQYFKTNIIPVLKKDHPEQAQVDEVRITRL